MTNIFTRHILFALFVDFFAHFIEGLSGNRVFVKGEGGYENEDYRNPGGAVDNPAVCEIVLYRSIAVKACKLQDYSK